MPKMLKIHYLGQTQSLVMFVDESALFPTSRFDLLRLILLSSPNFPFHPLKSDEGIQIFTGTIRLF
jgi:hypothetical protein